MYQSRQRKTDLCITNKRDPPMMSISC